MSRGCRQGPAPLGANSWSWIWIWNAHWGGRKCMPFHTTGAPCDASSYVRASLIRCPPPMTVPNTAKADGCTAQQKLTQRLRSQHETTPSCVKLLTWCTWRGWWCDDRDWTKQERSSPLNAEPALDDEDGDCNNTNIQIRGWGNQLRPNANEAVLRKKDTCPVEIICWSAYSVVSGVLKCRYRNRQLTEKSIWSGNLHAVHSI